MNKKQNAAKKYLSQAFGLNQRIESKIDQIAILNDLATKATVTYSDMPKSPNRAGSRMEDAICKIIDLEVEINKDIDQLVDLKSDITHLIKKVNTHEYQIVLEQRYLCFKTWEQISVDLGYSIQHTFRLHDQALREAAKVYKDES